MNNNDSQELYGFKVGEIVELLVTETMESNTGRKSCVRGSRIRLVCFVPKVKIYTADTELEKKFVDSKPYFFNAVPEEQWDSDYGNRIRANFCTIKKCEQPRYRAEETSVLDDQADPGKLLLCRTDYVCGVDEQNFRAKMIAAALNAYTGRKDM